ncbi:MAG TPA: hypothetical protein VGF59_19880 [Bryobacteraceae bacterium]
MTWPQIVASVLWAIAAVVVAAWYLLKFARQRRATEDERRAYPRPPVGFRATLTVQKLDGASTTLRARGYDLNKFGAMVAARYPLVPGTVVVIEIRKYALIGIGHVRHCTQQGMKFWIGMEFKNQLMRSPEGTWKFSVMRDTAQQTLESLPSARAVEIAEADSPRVSISKSA